MDIDKKLKDFEQYARESYKEGNTIAIYLVKSTTENDLWGFLYIDENSELQDNHCEKCADEPVLFFKTNGNSYLQYTSLCGAIGQTKLNKILNGRSDYLVNVVLDKKLIGLNFLL